MRPAFARVYNSFGENKKDYKHSFSMQYLDMENEVLLADEFWDVVGGKGTSRELLDIYQEVGREKNQSDDGRVGFWLLNKDGRDEQEQNRLFNLG